MSKPTLEKSAERYKLINQLPEIFHLSQADFARRIILQAPELFLRVKHGWYKKIGEHPLPESPESIRKAAFFKAKQ